MVKQPCFGNIVHTVLENVITNDSSLDYSQIETEYQKSKESYDPDQKISEQLISVGKEILDEFYDENMDKKNQSSDWGKKILTKDQLEYAAEDVRFLVSLEQILTEMLIREKRFELAEQCFQFVSTLIQLDFLEMKDTLEH